LAAITTLMPLSLHLFFPAVPSVKDDFKTTESIANLTVSLPLFVMAFASLVYGSLSDRLGRRTVLLGAIALFVSGSIVSALADQIWILIAGRILQAAGGGGGLGLARTIARDVFGADKLMKVLSYLTMAYAMGPMIAAPIGGFLVDQWGWRSCLILAGAFGVLIAILCWLRMFETQENTVSSGARMSIFRSYIKLLGNFRFTSFVLQSGFTSSVFFTMAAASSFLMIDYLGRPASEYGMWFICFPAGFLTGSLISSQMSGRVRIETMVLIGSIIMTLGALTQVGFILVGVITPLTIFLPGYFAIMSQGIALPSAQAGAINTAGTLAGTAAGIGVFIQLFAAGISTQIYGLIANGTPYPMALVVSVLTICTLIVGVIPFMTRDRGSST
tara:strand:- start:4055 stop:5215 length:1161 start_codon:yes stop_codon:yes gene_type:complete